LSGGFCSPRTRVDDGPTGGEEAATGRLGDGGGSVGAPAGGNPSSKRGSSPVAAFPGQQASREGHDHARVRKEQGGDALHRRRRLHGGGKEQRRRCEIDARRVRVCAAKAKGEHWGECAS
jgi:hypothetical protein